MHARPDLPRSVTRQFACVSLSLVHHWCLGSAFLIVVVVDVGHLGPRWAQFPRLRHFDRSVREFVPNLTQFRPARGDLVAAHNPVHLSRPPRSRRPVGRPWTSAGVFAPATESPGGTRSVARRRAALFVRSCLLDHLTRWPSGPRTAAGRRRRGHLGRRSGFAGSDRQLDLAAARPPSWPPRGSLHVRNAGQLHEQADERLQSALRSTPHQGEYDEHEREEPGLGQVQSVTGPLLVAAPSRGVAAVTGAFVVRGAWRPWRAAR